MSDFQQKDILVYERAVSFKDGVVTCGDLTFPGDPGDFKHFIEQVDALGQAQVKQLAAGVGFEVEPWNYNALRPAILSVLQNVWHAHKYADTPPNDLDALLSGMRKKAHDRIAAYHGKLAAQRLKPVKVPVIKPLADLIRGGTGAPRTRVGVAGGTYLYQLDENAAEIFAKFPAGGQKALVVRALADLNRPATAREVWDQVQQNGSFVTGQGQRASDFILNEGAKPPRAYIIKTLKPTEPPATPEAPKAPAPKKAKK